jgi:hypothetical protein
MPFPAISGAEPWIGSYRPGPARPQTGGGQHPHRTRQHGGFVGQDVAEHVFGDDHIHPGGTGDQAHRSGIHQHVLQFDIRVLRADLDAICRHRRDDSSTLALSTEVTFFLRPLASLKASSITRRIS